MPDNTTNTGTPSGSTPVTEVDRTMRTEAGSDRPGGWADTIAAGARARTDAASE